MIVRVWVRYGVQSLRLLRCLWVRVWAIDPFFSFRESLKSTYSVLRIVSSPSVSPPDRKWKWKWKWNRALRRKPTYPFPLSLTSLCTLEVSSWLQLCTTLICFSTATAAASFAVEPCVMLDKRVQLQDIHHRSRRRRLLLLLHQHP